MVMYWKDYGYIFSVMETNKNTSKNVRTQIKTLEHKLKR
jgi:hypothetical protein